MKISDYIMQFIHGLGVDHVFYVSGGGAMHMNDSLGRSEMTPVAMLFEQGAAIAAEGYARARDGYGCCLVTSGPGATNAVTGCVGAFIDSIPLIFLSGQAKRADLRDGSGVRQFGIQEADIVSIVKNYTKYAKQIEKPEDIRYELEKAASLAVNGRPGPVWLDVPLDIQASEVEPEKLRGFTVELPLYTVREEDLLECIRLFNASERPIVMLGHGVRLSHAIPEARALVELLGAPVLTTWNGVDLLEDDHPLYTGRGGNMGDRAGNFAVQNADLILAVGTRISIRQGVPAASDSARRISSSRTRTSCSRSALASIFWRPATILTPSLPGRNTSWWTLTARKWRRRACTRISRSRPTRVPSSAAFWPVPRNWTFVREARGLKNAGRSPNAIRSRSPNRSLKKAT